MSTTLHRPRRNTRKRKRAHDFDDINDINIHHEPKRRKKIETFSERSADGFCNYCTDPYKLICCKQCSRSWHLNCLKKYLRNGSQNHRKHENDSQIPLKPITNNTINTINNHQHECNPNNNAELAINMPKSLQFPPISDHEEVNGIEIEICEWEKNEKEIRNKNPDPIQLINMTPNESLNNIRKWVKNITPSIMTHSQLYNDTLKKQIIALFVCTDCLNKTHQCFICKTREKEQELPQKCNARPCGKYYHRSCLLSDKCYSFHTQFYMNGNIKCPAHHCWSCYELSTKTKNNNIARKTCWYCPRSYHRNCVPLTAELMSLQITDNDVQIQRYPDFRYDLITCCWNDSDKLSIDQRVPFHPKPKDLQFGRNDVKAGIFKWKLWDKNGSIAQFYRLEDDPFSIDISLVNQYKEKRNNKNKKRKKNPYPTNFRKIRKLKYGKDYKKAPTKPDYGRCSCVNGCSLDWSCTNYSMDIECNGHNCGLSERDIEEGLCENRQFASLISSDNVEIKSTFNGRGFGSFAKRDLRSNQLIIEYVGEVISKQESTRRIKELNAIKSQNFYFFQVDSKTVIDGTLCGNESRFLNHSCDANCYTRRWSVDGEDRLGIFAAVNIKKGGELTYDYQYEVPDPDDTQTLAKCLCGTKKCRFFLGFNKKKAAEWKEKQKLEGNYVSCEDEEEIKRKKKKKKKKRKKHKHRSKKKKKHRSKKKKKSKKKHKSKKEEKDIGSDMNINNIT